MDLRDYYDDHWTHVPEGQVRLHAPPVRGRRARARSAGARRRLRPWLPRGDAHGARALGRRHRRLRGGAGANPGTRDRCSPGRPRHRFAPIRRRRVRRGGGQLEPRAPLLHAAPHPRMRALCQARRAVHLARPEHRALAVPALASVRPVPVRPEQPDRRVPHPLRDRLRRQEAARRGRADEDPPARPRRDVGARALPATAREQATRSATSTRPTSCWSSSARRSSRATCASIR